MSATVVNIIPRKHVEAAQTTQYTAVGVKTIIDKFTLTNTGASNVVFSCNLIASGGAAAASNLIIDARVIVPEEVYLCPELVGQTLEPGGIISTLCDTGLALTISASGREIT